MYYGYGSSARSEASARQISGCRELAEQVQADNPRQPWAQLTAEGVKRLLDRTAVVRIIEADDGHVPVTTAFIDMQLDPSAPKYTSLFFSSMPHDQDPRNLEPLRSNVRPLVTTGAQLRTPVTSAHNITRESRIIGFPQHIPDSNPPITTYVMPMSNPDSERLAVFRHFAGLTANTRDGVQPLPPMTASQRGCQRVYQAMATSLALRSLDPSPAGSGVWLDMETGMYNDYYASMLAYPDEKAPLIDISPPWEGTLAHQMVQADPLIENILAETVIAIGTMRASTGIESEHHMAYERVDNAVRSTAGY